MGMAVREPVSRAGREDVALPAGEVGPVDFWVLRRLALSCAWAGIIWSQPIATTGTTVWVVDGSGCY